MHLLQKKSKLRQSSCFVPVRTENRIFTDETGTESAHVFHFARIFWISLNEKLRQSEVVAMKVTSIFRLVEILGNRSFWQHTTPELHWSTGS